MRDNEECCSDDPRPCKGHVKRLEELEIHSDTQAATIRTLKALLEQTRAECEQLRDCKNRTKETTSSVKSVKARPATAPRCDSTGPTDRDPVCDLNKKIKHLEAVNVRLAQEIETLSRTAEADKFALSTSKTKVQSLLVQKEKLACSTKVLIDELRSSKEALSAETQRVTELSSRISGLSEEMLAIKAELAETVPKALLVQETAKAEKSRLSLEDEMNEIKKRSDDLMQQNQRLSDENSVLAAELYSKTCEFDRVMADHAELETSFREAVVRIECMQKTNAHNEKTYQARIESLEAAHALSVSLLEQGSEIRLGQYESELKIMRENMSMLHDRVRQLDRENAQLKTEVMKVMADKLSNLHVAVHACPQEVHVAVGTEYPKVVYAYTQTDPSLVLSTNSLTECIRQICCENCSSTRYRAVATLFPCGHGVCEHCLEQMIKSDKDLCGISCSACADNLPISFVCKNQYLGKLSNLFYNFEHLAG